MANLIVCFLFVVLYTRLWSYGEKKEHEEVELQRLFVLVYMLYSQCNSFLPFRIS